LAGWQKRLNYKQQPQTQRLFSDPHGNKTPIAPKITKQRHCELIFQGSRQMRIYKTERAR
jgi:hypothetical protein